MLADFVGSVNTGVGLLMLGFICGVAFAAWRQTVIEREEEEFEDEETEEVPGWKGSPSRTRP